MTSDAEEPIDQPSPSQNQHRERRHSEHRRHVGSRVISGQWGLSVTVVVIMLGALAANLTAQSSASQRMVGVETKLEATSATLAEIKAGISNLTGATQNELSKMKDQNADLRAQFARDVGDLRVQIAELRSAVFTHAK